MPALPSQPKHRTSPRLASAGVGPPHQVEGFKKTQVVSGFLGMEIQGHSRGAVGHRRSPLTKEEKSMEEHENRWNQGDEPRKCSWPGKVEEESRAKGLSYLPSADGDSTETREKKKPCLQGGFSGTIESYLIQPKSPRPLPGVPVECHFGRGGIRGLAD